MQNSKLFFRMCYFTKIFNENGSFINLFKFLNHQYYAYYVTLKHASINTEWRLY